MTKLTMLPVLTKDDMTELRRCVRVTQAQMAERLGVHLYTWVKWEHGYTPSRANTKLILGWAEREGGYLAKEWAKEQWEKVRSGMDRLQAVSVEVDSE